MHAMPHWSFEVWVAYLTGRLIFIYCTIMAKIMFTWLYYTRFSSKPRR